MSTSENLDTYDTLWPICGICRAIPATLFRTAANDTTHHQHPLWPSFTAFGESASRGCHTCTLLYEAVREPFKSRLASAPVFIESISKPGQSTRVTVLTVDQARLATGESNHVVDQSRNEALDSLFQYTPIADVNYVLDIPDIPDTAKRSRYLISQYPEDQGALGYIRQNMNTCMTDHRYTCNRVMMPLTSSTMQLSKSVDLVDGVHGLVFPPTRLVYVGSDSTDDPPRIVDGRECLNKGGYIVLSYCWGYTPRDAKWQLTLASRDRFANAIPIADLPQTLHDALLWTRQLEHQYIWIDSMCIIQDYAIDRNRELSRMALIYGSASMTLVAAASSVYGGITDRRNPLRNNAAALRLDNGNEGLTVYVIPKGHRRATQLPPPTEDRGWCFQEDMLSSRLVKVTQNSITWQCTGESTALRVRAARAQSLARLTDHPIRRYHLVWYRFIESYSSKKLTNPSDKLVAFFGIASDKIGRKYHAGFLETDPWASLLWCRDEFQFARRPGSRYREYIAPSWSWASIDAPVLFYEAQGRQSRDPQLEPVKRDPDFHSVAVRKASFFDTGAVKGGNIQITAETAIVRTASVEPFLFNTGNGAHSRGRRNLYEASSGRIVGIIVFDIADEARDNMLLCCALLHTANVGLWEKNGTAGLGIALRVRRYSPQHLCCSRVGYVQFLSSFSLVCRRRRLYII